MDDILDYIVNLMKSLSISHLLTLLALLSLGNSWCYKSYFTVPGESSIIDISPDNAYMAITSIAQNAVLVYELANYNLLLTYTPASDFVQSAKFTNDGLYLGIGLKSGVVNLLSGKPTFSSAVLITVTSAGRIADIDFNKNNTRMVVCYSNLTRYDIYNYTGTVLQFNSTVNVPNTIIRCRYSLNDDVGLIDNNKFIKIYSAAGAATTSIAAAANYKSIDIKQTTTTPIKFIVSGNDAKGYFGLNGAGSATANTFSPSSSLTGGGGPLMGPACYSGDNQYYAYGGGTPGSDFRTFIFADNDTIYNVFSDSTVSLLSCSFTPDGSSLYYGSSISGSVSMVYIYKKNCFECPLGYYLTSNTVCTLCNAAASMFACASCSNASVCISCYSGYYLNQSTSLCYKCDYLDEGCSTCANATYCYECNMNYFVNSSKLCQSCASTQTGCLTCTSSSSCLTCTEEFYLSGSGSCIRCNNTKANCLRCSSSSTCAQCQFGFYLNAGTCTSCNSNCISCYNSATNCSVCARGYYVSSFACTTCTTDCLECNGTNFCFDCKLGTYLTATGTCSPCALACNTCNSTNCLSCTVGNYLSGTTCISCATNCSACLNSTNCSTCSLGYYLTAGNICLNCHYLFNNCSTCNLTQCFSCEVGYYLSAGNTCLSCVTLGCLICNSTAYCQSCALGYYLTASNACSLCSTTCDTCYATSTNCTSCIPSYYLSGNTCLTCNSNCQTCNGTTCFSCNIGYYLSSGSCSACKGAIYGCLDCLNTTYCSECQIGKYLSSTFLCLECPISCGSCNATICMSCNVGYYLSSNSCLKCMGNCSQCYTSTNCFSCNPGFYYNSGLATNQCTSCSGISRGCLTCNSTACFNCEIGYYLDSTTKTCIFCETAIANCLFCTSSTYCQYCSQGFYMNAANTACVSCFSAIDGCEACTDSTHCLTCSIGYYYNANSCVVCPNRCLTCNATSCITCTFRYVWNSSDCITCSSLLPHCEICNNSTTCLRCFEGFYLSSGTCVTCQSQLVGCAYCNSSAICTNCLDGFYLSSNACSLCSLTQGCRLCSSAVSCSDCSSGYILSVSTCVLCQSLLPNCIFCTSTTTCTQCQAGFYLNGGTCSSCSSALSQCIYCSNGTQCNQCEGGYYLNNLICSPCTVDGCELCTSTSPNQCINCYSGYFLSGSSCLSCNSTGCLDCTQASVCLACQLGYYLSSSTCLLCSTAMSGCNKCSSSSVCTECQTLFYLAGSSCVPCSGALTGCGFCTNSSACLSCNSGYYLNASSLCSLCTSLTGCLLCTDISTCIYCNSGYYLSTGTCLSCSNIGNCSVCANATNCTSCVSGYSLSSGACVTAQVSTGGSASAAVTPVTNVKFKSFYISADTLKHILQAVGMAYTKVNGNWTTDVKIALGNKTSSTALTIKSVEWGRSYELIFYTNNPLNYTKKSLPLTNRMLIGQTVDLNLNTSIQINQPLLVSLLPNLLVDSALTLGYSLNDPQFYNSYISSVYNTYYYVVGAVVTSLLLLNYLIKALCTVRHSNNHGNILGHIFALKTISISLYPTFGEYINFSFGFMMADLPWLNSWFGYMLSDDSDQTPPGFLLYFSNMSLYSTYLLPLVVLLCALGLAYMILKDNSPRKFQLEKKTQSANRSERDRFTAIYQLLVNFFYFGMAFAGCASLQGSILNPNNIISINGSGYALGIVLYVVVLGHCINSVFKQWQFGYLRLFVKATLLSAAHFNPIYIFAVALVLDVFLLVVEMRMKSQFTVCPKLTIANHLLVNLALSIFFYMPDSLISIYISSAAITLVVLVEVYLHYTQRRIGFKDYPHFNKEKVVLANEDVSWKINPNDYSLEKENIITKEKESQPLEDYEGIPVSNDQEMSTKYTKFMETSNSKEKSNRRARRFRDTSKSRTTLNSSWTNFDLNNSNA